MVAHRLACAIDRQGNTSCCLGLERGDPRGKALPLPLRGGARKGYLHASAKCFLRVTPTAARMRLRLLRYLNDQACTRARRRTAAAFSMHVAHVAWARGGGRVGGHVVLLSPASGWKSHARHKRAIGWFGPRASFDAHWQVGMKHRKWNETSWPAL